MEMAMTMTMEMEIEMEQELRLAEAACSQWNSIVPFNRLNCSRAWQAANICAAY